MCFHFAVKIKFLFCFSRKLYRLIYTSKEKEA